MRYTTREIKCVGDVPAVTAEAILMNRATAGDNVVVVGGGLVGCETGLWLAQQGKTVTVVEMTNHILGGHGAIPHMNEFMLVDLLKFHNVTIHTGAQLKTLTEMLQQSRKAKKL